jgi:hypothetical protein
MKGGERLNILKWLAKKSQFRFGKPLATSKVEKATAGSLKNLKIITQRCKRK